MSQSHEQVPVEGGAVPVIVQGPEDASRVPGLVVIPSIFGPAPDLLRQVAALSDVALTVVADPFWREGGGVIAYQDPDPALARLRKYDWQRWLEELRAVIEWTRDRCNGKVVALGICFGGPSVLVAAKENRLAGGITWHGSVLQNYLDGADRISCPLRFHFGDADPVTPPEVIDAVREAFSAHPDLDILVHPGLAHGFSHEGSAYDEEAAQTGVEETRALLEAV